MGRQPQGAPGYGRASGRAACVLARAVVSARRAVLGVRWDDIQTAGPGQQGPSAQALAAPTLTAVQVFTILFTFPQLQVGAVLTTQAS